MTASASPERFVYVVDVCGTLVLDDTTLGLLCHHFRLASGGSSRRFMFCALTARHSPLRLGLAIIEKLTGLHVLKHAAVRLLAGSTVESLDRSALEYAELLLKKRRVQPVWRVLESSGARDELVLASASLEPIVGRLASVLGARHVASALEQREGILTGRYANDLTGRKVQALQGKYGALFLAGKVVAISDNYTDRSLLEAASNAYVVLHREAHRARWAGLKAVFLRLEE